MEKAIVTGASSGIGAATASVLLNQDMRYMESEEISQDRVSF